MGFLKEFKAFALKGNVMDMAVGVIIGGAFGKIVTSLVNDVIMPPIGYLTGGVDFKDLKWVIQEATEATETTAALAEVSLKYGAFVQQIIDFLIIALSVFMMIKLVNKLSSLRKKEEEAQPEPEPAPALLPGWIRPPAPGPEDGRDQMPGQLLPCPAKAAPADGQGMSSKSQPPEQPKGRQKGKYRSSDPAASGFR